MRIGELRELSDVAGQMARNLLEEVEARECDPMARQAVMEAIAELGRVEWLLTIASHYQGWWEEELSKRELLSE